MSATNPAHAARCACNNCRYEKDMAALSPARRGEEIPSPVSGKAEEMPEGIAEWIERAREEHLDERYSREGVIRWLASDRERLQSALDRTHEENDAVLRQIYELDAKLDGMTLALDRAEREIAGYRKALGLLVESDPLSGRASLPQP